MVASVTPTINNIPNTCVRTEGLRFVETGAGTYTGTVTIPAYAVLLDVLVYSEALWTAATSASLVVGDDDDADGIFTATNLKATDLTLGQGISFQDQGGVGGAYLTAGTSTHITNRVSASERTLTATITSVGAGTAGRTIVAAVWGQPVLDQVDVT